MEVKTLFSRNEQGTRHATWLELFYDLAFVVALTEISRRATGNLTMMGLFQSVFLFLPVVWAWMGHTFYSTRFDTDDYLHRILTLLQMLFALGLALTVHGALEELSVGFGLSYLSVRLILLALYTRARLRIPEVHGITTLYLSGFTLGVLIWTASFFVSPPLRFALWGISLAADLITPWLGIRLLSQNPVDTRHLPERFGLFTIVLLGEHFLTSTNVLDNIVWSPLDILTAVASFCLVALMWWLYFLYLQEWEGNRCIRGGQPFAYLHLLLWMGMLGNIISVEYLLPRGGDDIPLIVRGMLFGSVALWLFILAALDHTLRDSEKRRAQLSLGVAGLTLLLGFLMVQAPGFACVLSLITILFFHVSAQERWIHGRTQSMDVKVKANPAQ
ncbi:MAG: low temperature requirement protein [Candidatus Peribacteria bacterium]|nr:low temperature requirement protein [Candidatus Peribacteria bacterium]